MVCPSSNLPLVTPVTVGGSALKFELGPAEEGNPALLSAGVCAEDATPAVLMRLAMVFRDSMAIPMVISELLLLVCGILGFGVPVVNDMLLGDGSGASMSTSGGSDAEIPLTFELVKADATPLIRNTALSLPGTRAPRK